MIDRYYDPATGQFLSIDPELGQAQQPYAYVGGDPVNETDPTGDMIPISGGGSSSSSSSTGGPGHKVTVAPGGTVALNFTSQHAVAVYTAVTDIIRQLAQQGWGPATIARNLILERPVPGGSKKKTGRTGRPILPGRYPMPEFLSGKSRYGPRSTRPQTRRRIT
jgi:uncharacterized protein RhaS with RHS repeats